MPPSRRSAGYTTEATTEAESRGRESQTRQLRSPIPPTPQLTRCLPSLEAAALGASAEQLRRFQQTSRRVRRPQVTRWTWDRRAATETAPGKTFTRERLTTHSG